MNSTLKYPYRMYSLVLSQVNAEVMYRLHSWQGSVVVGEVLPHPDLGSHLPDAVFLVVVVE